MTDTLDLQMRVNGRMMAQSGRPVVDQPLDSHDDELDRELRHQVTSVTAHGLVGRCINSQSGTRHITTRSMTPLEYTMKYLTLIRRHTRAHSLSKISVGARDMEVAQRAVQLRQDLTKTFQTEAGRLYDSC